MLTLSYSQAQLEAAVSFIASNNNHFKGRNDYIRASMLTHMKQIASDPEQCYGSTMGYTLIAERDEDNPLVSFDILVDPCVGAWATMADDDEVTAAV